MYLAENLIKKWEPVLNHESLPEIKDHYKRTLTAIMLENQEKSIREQRSADQGFLTETTTNTQSGVDGGGAGFSGGANASPVAGYDPIMISLVRRAMPQLIAYDVCGVQPMTGPTGLIFAMKSTYADQGGVNSAATEALFDEAIISHSAAGQGTTAGGGTITAEGAANNPSDPFATTKDDGTTDLDAPTTGMDTATAEQLGGTSGHFREMSFSIDKTSVTAVSRALKAEYTTELAQDLKAVHGLDAETELANILSTEILAEINREIIRTINYSAVDGAQTNVATQGTFDLDKDSNGRWSVEKFKGLMFQIERDANGIGIDTRRGRGNIIITSPDVASALSMAGVLDYNPAIQNSLDSDVTTNSFAGTLNGKYKVYVDPYAIGPNGTTRGQNANEYYTMGYKGTSPYDAGLFYCPYVPLQMVKAMGEDTFQPKIGFKTRYGVVPNPFVGGTVAKGNNTYYRKVTVSNLM
tara:strand:- start:29 stop:1432 length:1404 start_codon:yes stop_codon:yes gene_type:complete